MKNSNKRLTPAQREEITRRALNGEKQATLAKEFQISAAYIYLLKKAALQPAPAVDPSKWKSKLSPREQEQLRDVFATSTPELQKLEQPDTGWTIQHGQQLAKRFFGKSASVRIITDLITPYLPKRKPYEFKRPQPPKPHHISQLSPELAADPEFVAYYLSAKSEKLAWREYEIAVADYDSRFATPEELAQIALEKMNEVHLR